jgi:hypothetical protein
MEINSQLTVNKEKQSGEFILALPGFEEASSNKVIPGKILKTLLIICVLTWVVALNSCVLFAPSQRMERHEQHNGQHDRGRNNNHSERNDPDERGK